MIKFKDINYNRNSYFNESIEKFISRISLSAALTGKSKTCKNFIWKYDAIER